MSVMQSDKLNALIMLSVTALVQKNLEELQIADYSIEVPSSLDRKVVKSVRNQSWDKTQNKVRIFLKRSCAVILIICTTLFAFAMSIEAVRDALWEMVTEWFDEYVTIGYRTETLVPTVIKEKKEPSWFPQEYEREVMTDSISAYVVRYFLNGKTVLTYKQFVMKSSYSMDGEGAEFADVQIGTSNGLYVMYAEGHRALEWSEGQYILSIISQDNAINLETMIRIAESVK